MKHKKSLVDEGIKVVDILYNKFLRDKQPYKYLSTEELEDIKQSAYLKMLETVKRYDIKRGTKLSTFLTPRIMWFFIDCLRKITKERRADAEIRVGIVFNESIESQEQAGKQLFISFDFVETQDTILKDFSFLIDDNDENAEVIDCICSLPQERVYLLLEYYIKEKPIKEISEELGYDIGSGWIYKLKEKTLDNLRQNLNKE